MSEVKTITVTIDDDLRTIKIVGAESMDQETLDALRREFAQAVLEAKAEFVDQLIADHE